MRDAYFRDPVNALALAVEEQRDQLVRLHEACPACRVDRGRACIYAIGTRGRALQVPQGWTSCTSRYLLAADAGVVPPLVGVRHLSGRARDG